MNFARLTIQKQAYFYIKGESATFSGWNLSKNMSSLKSIKLNDIKYISNDNL